MDLRDYLGLAAISKQEAKLAIKEKRYDDAWKYLHEQKMYYQKHALANKWESIHFLVLDSATHEDMANILRQEQKHMYALSNISYTYKTHHTASRPIITLERKLEAYYNRAYKRQPFKRFLSLLKVLPNSDYVSVRDFVERFFPLAPNEDEAKKEAGNYESDKSQQIENVKNAQKTIDKSRPTNTSTKDKSEINEKKLIHGVVLLSSPIKETAVKNIIDWNKDYFMSLDIGRPLLHQCYDFTDDINKLPPKDRATFWRLLNTYFFELRSVKKLDQNLSGNNSKKEGVVVQNLKTPLNNDELAKIDTFIDENIDEISKLSFEYFENIRLFQPKITNFDQYLSELTVNEKTRAWFYLFTNTKKARSVYLAKQGKDYPNPNYSSDLKIKSKLKGEVVFGLIVLALIFSFAIYKFVFSTSDYDKCVANGIQYYKDIGSYPMLKSENISANSKAKDNCSRSTVAFGDID